MIAQDFVVSQGEEEVMEEMASGLHGVIASRVNGYLFIYLLQNKLGHVLDSSTTYNFGDDLPRRESDVSFVSLEKMPIPLDSELAFAPDLAVEVVSKNDKVYELETKLAQYQKAGVSLIWVIYPNSQKVEVYRQKTGLIEQVVDLNGELDGENILPGFKLKVKALFD